MDSVCSHRSLNVVLNTWTEIKLWEVFVEEFVDAKWRSCRECGKLVMRGVRWRALRYCGRPESVKVLW